MILTLVNMIAHCLYGMRMETVWQVYGVRSVNLSTLKVNGSHDLTQDDLNHNESLFQATKTGAIQ